MKTKLFQLRISEAFKARIKKAALIQDMTITEYVRLAINEKLEKDSQ